LNTHTVYIYILSLKQYYFSQTVYYKRESSWFYSNNNNVYMCAFTIIKRIRVDGIHHTFIQFY
jgi:hypothetical protein